MIGFEEAVERVLEATSLLGTECLDLDLAVGRILAESVYAPFDLPRFDQSAVDGYAVRCADLASATTENPVRLVLAGEIPAGRVEGGHVMQTGETVRVFTGSKLPADADAVVMQEEVEADAELCRFIAPAVAGAHIRRRGEEVREGTRMLAPGKKIGAAEISLLATLGMRGVQCFQRPTVGILATGAELRPLTDDLRDGEIYASNALALAVAARACGAEVVDVRTIGDDAVAIAAAVEEMSTSCDVLITAGGISVGAHDHLRAAFQAAKIDEVFWRVAIKPGKPVFFGRHPGVSLVFGLPGNPVSALATFELFVAPALFALQGRAQPPSLYARLETSVSKKEGLTEFTRGSVTQDGCELVVRPTGHQGSHMLTGLTEANCLIELPSGRTDYLAGEIVRVRPIEGGLAR